MHPRTPGGMRRGRDGRRTRSRGAGRIAAGAALAHAVLLGACTVEQRTDERSVPDAQASAGPHRQIVQPEGVARLPVFSTAIRTGNLLFLSGQIGALPGVSPPQVIEGGVAAETRQTLENIRTVLEADGLTFQDVVKCTVFLADIADYGAMNDVYITFFPADPPARSAMAGSGLALGARVEIECIAAYPASH